MELEKGIKIEHREYAAASAGFAYTLTSRTTRKSQDIESNTYFKYTRESEDFVGY